MPGISRIAALTCAGKRTTQTNSRPATRPKTLPILEPSCIHPPPTTYDLEGIFGDYRHDGDIKKGPSWRIFVSNYLKVNVQFLCHGARAKTVISWKDATYLHPGDRRDTSKLGATRLDRSMRRPPPDSGRICRPGGEKTRNNDYQGPAPRELGEGEKGAEDLNKLEAASGFEPENNGFADRCLTTWLCRPKKYWSGKRDSNPRLQPWQGCTLPLSYSRSTLRSHLYFKKWTPLCQDKTGHGL